LTWVIVFFACPLAPFSSVSLANEEEAAVSQSAAEAVSDVPGQLTAIPGESGLSGSVILGASYNWLKSNMIAGNDFGDVGRERIDSIFDDPDSESDFVPAVSVDLRYTFAESGTQLFLGNRLEDLLRYDLSFQAGVRQDIGNPGILGAAFVFSAVPTEVWKDPYVEGEKRRRTDRRSTGVRVTWERLFQQRLRLEYTYRKIDLDRERSGTFLGLTDSERDRLDRQGDFHEVEALYTFAFAGNHTLSPSIKYTLFDLDGGAMKNDGFSVQLTHTYNQDRFTLVSNLYLGYADYDKRNPIYGKTREEDNYGFTLTAFWHEPFGWRDWSLLGSAAYAKSDSNIDFYDKVGFIGTGGVLYRF
jgi:hypothetical protein